MLKPYSFSSILFSGVAVATLGTNSTVSAQNYPSKPIRIVTVPPGGGGDIASRIIVQFITTPLGQPVIVENRPVGVIPGQVVSQSSPDGYTLLYSGSSLWLGPFLRSSTPYDPVRDFQPIIQTVRQPALLVATLGLPVTSAKDLIALAKARPGELNYAAFSLGSLNHLAAELFQSMADVKLQRIDYRSGAQAVQDLIGGRVQVMFGTASLSLPHVKSGKLKALGVTSALPTELVPGVPTIAASGLPGYSMDSNQGILAPAKTPRAIVVRLNQEIRAALLRPEVKEKFFATGAEPVGGSPEQFESVIKNEMVKLGKLIKERGIREE